MKPFGAGRTGRLSASRQGGTTPLTCTVRRRRRTIRRAGRSSWPVLRRTARGDAQLPVDRADLGADGVAGHEQPLPDLANREVRLQVGKQAKLRRTSRGGGHADAPGRVSDATDGATPRPHRGVTPSAGRCRTISSISRSRWRAVDGVAHREVDLGELQPHPHGEAREHERQRGTCSHRPREPGRFASDRSPRCTASLAAPANVSTLVAYSFIRVVFDGREGSVQVLGGLRPPPTVHGHQRELSLAQDAHVGVARRCRCS